MALLICQACFAQPVLIGPEDTLLLSAHALTLVILAGHHVPRCYSAFMFASSSFKPLDLAITGGQFGSSGWRVGGPTGLVPPISDGPLVQPAGTRPGTCSVTLVKVSQSFIIVPSETRLKAVDTKLSPPVFRNRAICLWVYCLHDCQIL